MNKLLGTQVLYWLKPEWALSDTADPQVGTIAWVDDADPKALRVNIGYLTHSGQPSTDLNVPLYQSGDRPQGVAYCETPDTVGKYSAADKREAKAVEAVAAHEEPPAPEPAPKPAAKAARGR